jgi:putative endonuclease
MSKIGELGENLVARWLESKNWLILHQHWRCLWGEIDIIARSKANRELIFVEVKTRSQGNWDADGIEAITPKKQTKLRLTAELFLSEHPDLANFACRFDVALVGCRKSKQISVDATKESIDIGKSTFTQGYQLTLKHYIEAAWQ